jgi:Cu/Ag efflux protein CusF
MKISRRSLLLLVSGVLGVGLAEPLALAQQKGKKEYAFKGKVEKVDQNTKKLTVANEDIPGWMMAMTMTYGVDKESVLKEVKAGDQITATVYEGDVQTLYNVKVVPPERKK